MSSGGSYDPTTPEGPPPSSTPDNPPPTSSEEPPPPTTSHDPEPTTSNPTTSEVRIERYLQKNR